MSGIDDDDYITLNPEEVAALEASYGSLIAKPLSLGGLELPKPVAAAPAAPKVEAPAAKVEAPAVVVADKPKSDELTALQERLATAERLAAEERAKRERVEIEASGKDVKLAAANADVIANQYSTVVNARKQAEMEVDALRKKHQSAQEMGDYEAASKAVEELSDAKYKVNVLRDGEEALKTQHADAAKAAKSAAEAPPPKPSEPADPVEAFISKLGPREQAWAREHPEAFRDPKKSKRLTGLHNMAESEGIEPGTDQYFAYLDKGMGYVKPEAAAAEESVIVETQKPVEPAPVAAKADEPRRVSAPVSRGQPTSESPSRFQLSRAQKQVADAMGMSHSKYAAHIVKLQSASKDPNYAGPRLSGN